MSTASEDDTTLIQRVIVGAVIIGVGLVILSQIISVGSIGSLDGSIRVGDDGVVELKQTKGVDTVRDSTGRAARLSGGEVALTGTLGVTDDNDGNWTFGTYAAVENSSRGSVFWSLEDEVVVGYTPSSGEYFAWYYNESTGSSYSVSVAAGSPTDLSPVLLERDGQTLRLINETGASRSVTIAPSTESSAALPTSNNLRGRLEETRTWDRPLTTNEQSAYRSDGIQPVAVGNRSARILFDTSGDDVAVEFRGTSGSLQGTASRGTGLAGTTMTRGTDYEVVSIKGGNALAVKPLAGGALEDQPRIALQTPPTEFEQFVQLLGVTFGLGGLVLIVVIARRVLEVVQTT